MQRQELIALLKAEPDRKYWELEQDAKDAIAVLLRKKPGPQTKSSTILEKLRVSGNDPETSSLSDGDGGGAHYHSTSSSSPANLIALLEEYPDRKYWELEQDAKDAIAVLLRKKPGPQTKSSTILEKLRVSGNDPDTLSLSGGIDSPVSLSPADDAVDTMSEVSLSRSEGNGHQPSPQTRGFLGSWFSRGQAENSHDDHQDPPPAVAEPEPVQEPVMVKSDVLRIIHWFKVYIGKLKDENRGLMDTMTSMEEHIRNLEKLPKNQPYQFLNADELMRAYTSDL